MPRQPHFYLIQTDDYVKLGITDRPRPRLKEHCVEIDRDLAYHSLWTIDRGSPEALEDEVKRLLADCPKHSKERVKVDIDRAYGAVLKAAGNIDAIITPSKRKLAARRPRRHNRVTVKVTDDEMAGLYAALGAKGKNLYRGRPDVVRTALLQFIEDNSS